MVSADGKQGISDGAFFICSCVLFLVLSIAMAVLSGLFSGSIWMLGDTSRFFEMARVIISGGIPYVDYHDPKPPLIFFLLAVPAALGVKLWGGLLLVASANFISAVIILKIGWNLYGRGAGLLAGIFFILSMALAEGYFVLTEPFSTAFMLLSAYFLFIGRRNGYLAAGICAGLAIGFKQYALLIVPVSLIYAFRKGETKAFLPYMTGMLLPLFIMFAAIFLWYGVDAGTSALYWSFGVGPAYIADGTVGDVSAYRISDPVIATAWVLLALSLFMPLLVLAASSIARWKLSIEDEFLAIAALAFAATLLIRPFLHYWAMLLPFLALLAARACGRLKETRPGLRIGDRAYFIIISAFFAAMLLTSALASNLMIEGLWRPLSIQEFYGLADIVLRSTSGYLGHFFEPAAISVSYRLPAIAGILATASICVACTMIVTATAWRLYGRFAAFVAGFIFTAGVSFALGNMLPTDAAALLLLLVSLYLMLTDLNGKYYLAGLFMGTAIAIKPFALPLVFAGMLYMFLDKKMSKAFQFIVFALIPIAAISAVIAAGGTGGGISWNPFPYVFFSQSYGVIDPLLAMVSLAATGAFITSTLLFAMAALLRGKAAPAEVCLMAMALAPLCTLPFREFTHYWFVALPFAAILCARLFSANQKVIMQDDI